MTSIEIGELKRLAASYTMERVMPFEDVTGLASALVRRYLPGLGDSLDDYAASWDASREDPDGCTWPEWAALALDARMASFKELTDKIRDLFGGEQERVCFVRRVELGKTGAHQTSVGASERTVHERGAVQAAAHGDVVIVRKLLREKFRLQRLRAERDDPEGVGL